MAVADRRPGECGLGLGEVGAEQIGAGLRGREQLVAGDVDGDEAAAGVNELDELAMGVGGSSGGELPLSATTEPGCSAAATASRTRRQPPASSGGPGSLITVARPDCSRTIVVPRISPSTGTATTSRCSAASMPVAKRPSSPGNGPISRAGTPSVEAARQTLTALPPGVTATSAARRTSPGTSESSRTVRSIVWLRPMTSTASPSRLLRGDVSTPPLDIVVKL